MSAIPTPNPPSPTPTRGHLLISRAVVIVLVGLTAVLVVLAGFALKRSMGDKLEVETTGYHVIDASRISVDFVIGAPAHASVECEVRAAAADGLDVGAHHVTIEMAGQTRRTQRVELTTRRPAVSGQVIACAVK